MRITDLEDEIFEFEGVRVLFRTEDRHISIDSYPYKRRAPESTTIRDFIRKRLMSLFDDDDDIRVTVVNGYGETPSTRTHIQTVRDTYRT